MTSLQGKHVNWYKLEGNPSSWKEFEGFGCVYSEPKVGESLWITGDYGIKTSPVVSITINAEDIVVTTKNSVYSIVGWE